MQKIKIEIQNLRGFSILSVFCFHLLPKYFPNGYLGVDVFFVISGFLITQQLMHLENGRIANYLSEFYFRRFKRILPSAMSILVFSLVASYFLLGIVTFVDNLKEAQWVNLFTGNWFYSKLKIDYFSAGNISLFQHYWSLAIEEQFYLIWPLIIFLPKFRRVLPILIFAISLGFYLESNTAINFFSTFHRIWELTAGALLAIFPWRTKLVLPIASSYILLILILLPIEISQKIATLMTVFLTSALIKFGASAKIKGPFFYLGEISYSIYLVHFPVIKIFDELHPAVGIFLKAVLIILAVSALSILNFFFIESKFRNFKYPNQSKTIATFIFLIFLFEVTLIALKGYYV